MFDARALLGTHDFVLITLDSLRYDVACEAMAKGMTPTLQSLLPEGRWEQRETPGNFTYSAHHAFFAGFLPTPAGNPRYPRLFAARFTGSETTAESTLVFDSPDIITGFGHAGYHTVCVGGVGFFNKLNPLGCVFPALFQESHWSEETGVTSRTSTETQVLIIRSILSSIPQDKPLFLFLNVSATHQPTCIFAPSGATTDSIDTQAHALAYADRHLGTLFDTMQKRRPTAVIVCSDHGTAYGEDGNYGHRNNHPSVLTVPYGEFILEADHYAKC